MIEDKFYTRKKVNLDITHRCALECPRCPRQTMFKNNGLPVPGQDLSDKSFEKILAYMDHIDFEGQYSDPVHHPRFIHFLQRCYETETTAEIHNASSTKSLKWYRKAFEANPNAYWIFSIDGLPKDSHIYRINQDGEKLFNVMKEAKKYLNTTPAWQYIIFRYNQHDIQEAAELAESEGFIFYTIKSSRWSGPDDPYKPTIEEYKLEIK